VAQLANFVVSIHVLVLPASLSYDTSMPVLSDSRSVESRTFPWTFPLPTFLPLTQTINLTLTLTLILTLLTLTLPLLTLPTLYPNPHHTNPLLTLTLTEQGMVEMSEGELSRWNVLFPINYLDSFSLHTWSVTVLHTILAALVLVKNQLIHIRLSTWRDFSQNYGWLRIRITDSQWNCGLIADRDCE